MRMQHFGFDSPGPHISYSWNTVTARIFGALLLGLLPFFSLLAKAREVMIAPKPTSLMGKLDQAAALAAGVDKELWQFLVNAKIVQEAVSNNEPLFPTYREQLQQMLTFIHEWGAYLDKETLGEYYDLWRLLKWFSQHEEDVFSLLGEKREQTFLIILQNTSERRPNGGFFGSFGILKINKGKITRFEIVDSYLPEYDTPGTKITGPSWMLNYLPDRDIYFVWANKIGFTYFDGDHIATLYEKSYPGQQVAGVVFLRTDMFEELLPWFRKKIWERQFVNASVDLIRGSDEFGKKEFYLDESSSYFEENMEELAIAIFKNLPSLVKKRYINIYLADVSGPFHGLLRRGNLTTRFEEDHMYFRDSNIVFNKIDMFVDKIIQITNSDGQLIVETMDEIVPLGELPAGEYNVKVFYSLHIPDYYRTFIRGLIEKYGIVLTEREEHILGLRPNRSTRGVVYFPQNMSVVSSTWDYYHFSTFATPFANAAYYKSKITENNALNEIDFTIRLDE